MGKKPVGAPTMCKVTITNLISCEERPGCKEADLRYLKSLPVPVVVPEEELSHHFLPRDLSLAIWEGGETQRLRSSV